MAAIFHPLLGLNAALSSSLGRAAASTVEGVTVGRSLRFNGVVVLATPPWEPSTVAKAVVDDGDGRCYCDKAECCRPDSENYPSAHRA